MGEKLSQQTSALEQGLKQAGKRLTNHDQQIETLHTVDEEIKQTTSKLGQKTHQLKIATDSLENKSQGLSQAVNQLNSETDALQERSNQQEQGISSVIQDERHHFKMLGISLILVVLAVAVFSSYQQYRWHQENKLDQRVAQQFDLNAQQQVAMAQQVASLQQQLSAQHAAASAHQQDSEAMAQQVKVLKQKITRLKSELANMGDSVESLDGRVVAIAPLHQFGSDNTIHGPEWLASQPSNHYAIRLTSVASKQQLYKIADRYGHYLKQDLAYLKSGNHYQLIYGSFNSYRAAASAMRRMPSPDYRNRPQVEQLARIQARI
ncbi:hypothetical protein [endosymbiont of Ridgeia piscesae]|jgi:septal ring-binding cell division protein DamX|nr:hypothetical protein [endosymbiont of Ridgeia piscesae]